MVQLCSHSTAQWLPSKSLNNNSKTNNNSDGNDKNNSDNIIDFLLPDRECTHPFTWISVVKKWGGKKNLKLPFSRREISIISTVRWENGDRAVLKLPKVPNQVGGKGRMIQVIWLQSLFFTITEYCLTMQLPANKWVLSVQRCPKFCVTYSSNHKTQKGQTLPCPLVFQFPTTGEKATTTHLISLSLGKPPSS